MLNSNLEAIPWQISAKLLACAVAAAGKEPKSQQLEILVLEVIGPGLGRAETSIISSTVGRGGGAVSPKCQNILVQTK